MRVPLIGQTAVITLNGAGNGTAKIGPLSAREVWYPENVAVKANSNPTNEAQCLVYVGPDTTQPNFLDGCIDGSTGDNTGKVNGREIRCGHFIWAVWSGGDANVQATLTVTGWREI